MLKLLSVLSIFTFWNPRPLGRGGRQDRTREAYNVVDTALNAALEAYDDARDVTDAAWDAHVAASEAFQTEGAKK